MQKRKTTDGWWEEFFQSFRPFFDAIGPRTTEAEVRAVIVYLGLTRGKTFLDCPCGIGRIAVPLAKQGIRVTGVDFKQEYLDELQARAKTARVKIPALRADMRRIRFENEFDAAGNLWTSFGFFEKESDNLLVLKKMYRALKPGGRFLLHIINRDWLIKNYTMRGMHRVGKTALYEERRLDYRTSINHARCVIVRGNQKFHTRSHLRIYSLHELVGMFDQAGFGEIEAFGGYHYEPVNSDSRMLYVVGTKFRSGRAKA